MSKAVDSTKSSQYGIKVVNKEEKAWTEILERAEQEIEQNQRIIEIDAEVIKLAKSKIEQEQKRKA